MTVAAPSLTIVIPARDEAARLAPTLEAMRAYVDTARLSVEILVVDDGSRDSTAAVARRHGGASTRVIRLPHNRGKGAAVRAGVSAAVAPRILTCDADLATPIEELPRFQAALDAGADVAIGSRHMAGARIERAQPWSRRVFGGIFRLVARISLHLSVRDAMCGFKLFRADAARSLFARSVIDDYAFDLEVLYLARDCYRVVELPVRWRHVDGSRIHVRTAAWRAARDIVRIAHLHRR
jgi:dolichyl-phosphate beta-glucosyltransferase